VAAVTTKTVIKSHIGYGLPKTKSLGYRFSLNRIENKGGEKR